MNKFNAELVQRIAAEVTDAELKLDDMLAMFRNVPDYIADSLSAGDYDMRMALRGDAGAKKRLVESINHGAWSKFFSEHNAHHLLLDRERHVQYPYVYADAPKRKTYNDIRGISGFSAAGAFTFFNAWLLISDERLAKWLDELLFRTGASFKKHGTEFKTKMTLRGFDPYNSLSAELARVLYAVSCKLGQEFDFNKYYCEVRNNRVIDGAQFWPCELDFTIERHANGNATLRIGKDLVTALNNMRTVGV